MKRASIALALLAAASLVSAAEVVKRGAPVSAANAIPLATVLRTPRDYQKEPVVVEGTIEQACTRKGCWMQLAAQPKTPGVRVTFKDYGFFVPLDAKGMKARVEGVTKTRTLDKAEADHLVSEGATLTREADGSAVEVSFIASGVELRRE
jgi:hypothetical protein